MRILMRITAIMLVLGLLSSCLQPSKRIDPSTFLKQLSKPPETTNGMSGAIVTGEGLFEKKLLAWSPKWGDGILRVDWNADGKDEILALTSETEYSPIIVSLVAPDGSATTVFALKEGQYSGPPNAADVNADGKPELCIGITLPKSASANNPTATVLGQDGDALFSIDLGDVDQSCRIILADLRGDGQGQLIVLERAASTLSIFNAEGKKVEESKGGMHWLRDIEVGDVDGDGIKEVIGVSSDMVSLFTPDLAAKLEIQFAEQYLWAVPIDYNGDGTDELLLSNGALISAKTGAIYSSDISRNMIPDNPQTVAVADVINSPGLETAIMLNHPGIGDELIVLSQKGKKLYYELPAEYLVGMVSTQGVPGWPAGFLIQRLDGRLVFYSKPAPKKANK